MIDPDAFLMTLEEARKVHWLKNDPRPLGELYDEGYLDKARLEWAVAKAYNPRLRRAAMVLLKEIKPAEASTGAPVSPPAAGPVSPVPLGISLAEAEATLWPFSPCRGQPMGTLVETRQLSLKDLGYAAENAWDKQVRQAASALMFLRLGQQAKEPGPSAGYVKWISGGSRFGQRRQMQLNWLEGLILGIVFGGALTALLIYLFSQPASFYANLNFREILGSTKAMAALALLIVMIGVSILTFLLMDRLFKRMDREVENYRKGEEGEQRTVETILQTLDGTWTLFRNLQLPGRNKSDLDAVLVGPAGLWVLEVKNLSGLYRNTGETWEYQHKNRWMPYRSSPSRQASTAAARLGAFLKADRVRQWVEPAIVWADRESMPAVENPTVPVWPLERLPDELGNLWQEERIPAETRLRIVDKLTRLCEKNK